MAKVTTVLLQGVRYHWNGEDILVDDGVGLPWSLAGASLDQVELYNEEGEAAAAFSINFEQQNWLLQGEGAADEVILVDDNGAALIGTLSVTQDDVPLPVNLDDILLGSELEGGYQDATNFDIAPLDTELLDDVLNWLSVYSAPE